METMDVDAFMEHGLLTDEDEIEKPRLKKKTKKTSSHLKKDKPSTVRSHKTDLEKLQDTDPEFFTYLKENDAGLLDFNDSDESDLEGMEDEYPASGEEEEVEEEDEDDEEDEDENKEEDEVEDVACLKKKDKDACTERRSHLNLETVRDWSEQLQHNSLRALRHSVDALGSAVQSSIGMKPSTSQHYVVDSAGVLNALIRCCLRHVSNVIYHHVPPPDEGKGRKKKRVLPSSHPKWSHLRKTVKAYCQHILLILEHLKQPSMTCAVLRQMQPLLVYFICFPRLLRLGTRRLLRLWSSADEHVRVLAFLLLRRLLVANDTRTFQENCLKYAYMSFVRSCAYTSVTTLPLIRFMESSLIELFRVNIVLAYQQAFVYIRQLAIQLRKAMTTRTKEAHQAVYNWQYIHSLSLFSRLLADCHCDALKPLIFPLVEITFGVIQLLPTAQYFPLRFHCVRSLNYLSSKTGVYIPVSPVLLDVLKSSQVRSKAHGSLAKPPCFPVILKVTKGQLQTRSFQDCVVENVFDLLMEHLADFSHHIAFPELSLPTLIQVKQFVKTTKVPKFHQLMKQLVSKVNETAASVTTDRSSVSFAPKDTEQVQHWVAQRRAQPSSLLKFYTSWKELRERQLTTELSASPAAQAEEADDDDDDEEEEVEEKVVSAKKRKHSRKEVDVKSPAAKKVKKKAKKAVVVSSGDDVDQDDVVQTLDLSAWDGD